MAAENAKLTFCPDCVAPLTLLAVKDKLDGKADNSCRRCRVTPPPNPTGEPLLCARTGRELTDDDFTNGDVLRIGEHCVHMDAVREDRHAARERGLFHCDVCGVTLTPLDFLSEEAKVVDKVILCPRCYAENPDPAGNGDSASSTETPVGAAAVDDDARETSTGRHRVLKRRRRKRREDDEASSTSNVEFESTPVAPLVAEDDVEDPPSSSKADTSRRHTAETPAPEGLPHTVVPAAARGLNRRISLRTNGVAPSQPAVGDLRPVIGLLVVMVIVLSAMVAYLYLRGEPASNTTAETSADQASFNDLVRGFIERAETRLDRLQEDMHRLDMALVTLQAARDAAPAGTPTEQPGRDPDAASQPPHTESTPTTPTPAEPAADPLVTALRSADDAVRLEAIIRVNETQARSALPELRRVADRDADPYIQSMAIKALGEMRDREAIGQLERATQDASAIVRESAREVLALLRTE